MKIFFAIKDVDRKPEDDWENTWVSVSTDSGKEISSEHVFVAEIESCHELLFSWLVIVFGFFNRRTCKFESNCFCRVPFNRFMDMHTGSQRYAILSNRYADTCFANSLGDFDSVGEITLEFQVQDSTLVQAAASAPASQWDLMSETSLGKLLDMLSASYKVKDFVLADITHFHRGYKHLVKHFESMLSMQRTADNMRKHAAAGRDSLSSCIYTAPLEVDLAEQHTGDSACNAYRIATHGFYEYYLRMFYFAVAPYGNEIAVADVEGRLPCDTRGTETALEKMVHLLGIPAQDLLDVHITSIKGKCSFIMFLYRHYLVVSFRGTTSSKDIYEDFRYEYVRIEDGYTHLGIKELAESFVQDQCKNIRELMRMHGKTSLLLTGHSMGGSVAIVVGYIMLKTGFIENDKLKVVGISAVPVFSEHIVQNWSYRNFRTVAVDFDIVPFLSLGSFLDFKYICCWFGYCLNSGWRISDSHREVQKLQDFLLHENIYMKLYLPGSIIHLRTFERTSPDAFDELWDQIGGIKGAIWNLTFVGMKKYNYTFSRQICFSRNMINPHIPGVIQNVFQTAIKASKEIENARKSLSCAGTSANKKLVLA